MQKDKYKVVAIIQKKLYNGTLIQWHTPMLLTQ